MHATNMFVFAVVSFQNVSVLHAKSPSGVFIHIRSTTSSLRSAPHGTVNRRVLKRSPPAVRPTPHYPGARGIIRAVNPFRSQSHASPVTRFRVYQSWTERRARLNNMPNGSADVLPRPALVSGDPHHVHIPAANETASQRNSLLQLLDDRKSVIGNDQDINRIRQHLIVLNKLRVDDKSLDSQIHYIENITDFNIQREVLKIYIKDMIEKTGFTSQRQITVQDIDALRALIDKIGGITDKFMKTANGTFSNNTTGNLIPITATVETITINFLNASLNSDFRARIPDVLTDVSKITQLSNANVRDVVINNETSQTFHSQPATSENSLVEVGLSNNHNTVVPQAQETAIRSDSSAEEMGGTSPYWTHLQAGLANMLCNLCQQSQQTSCVRRYCQTGR